MALHSEMRPEEPSNSQVNPTADLGLDGHMQMPDTKRLWRPLSYRAKIPKELKDLDRWGDRAIGMVQRGVRSQRKLRAHAQEVIKLSQTMTRLAEEAFDREIDEAQDTARRGRRGLEARTHAFAVVREAVRRTVGLSLYEEQVMGGWVMEDGCIAEMLTGEGKTVTACLTAAVQGWMGYGVHVITVNDYLAKRDGELNTPIYKRLGLTVGIIQHASEHEERKQAYARDVTYTSDQQVIFDYLRDRLHAPLQPRLSSLLLEEITDTDLFGRQELWTEHIVLRGMYAAIVDEADSVLVDQATTPAIIGVSRDEEDASSEYYRVAAQLAKRLQPEIDYTIDRHQHRVDLTPAGHEELEKVAHELPSFWSGPRRRAELVTQALTAKELFHLHDHYIIRDDDVQIVDPHTGRVLEGRQWQLGLHQSIQAKENLPIKGGRQTMARMSYQNFFQLYQRIAGMTGTAWEVRDEIWRTYHMPVVRIPTHKPMIRKQRTDRFFIGQDDKFRAVGERIDRLYQEKRPVLLGTRSVEASEAMARELESRNIPHRILNAVRDEEEAAIIASAGNPGAITVATNMAGRGTDIILGQGVAKKGGLVVIATERNDTQRIDRQLFGRAGRQGDPGLAEVYVALDDQLITLNGMRPLVYILRRWPMLHRFGFHRLVWSLAQRGGSRRQEMARELVAKADQWFAKALYYEKR